MKIVFLDIKSLGEGLDFRPFQKYGEVMTYGYSSPEECLMRTQDADIVITNKCPINQKTIGLASHLKLVCTTGTGTNHFDKTYLKEQGIAWRNIEEYCTDSVAQHTFALLFYLLEHLRDYDDYVKEDHYTNDLDFSHYRFSFHEIAGKTWGIIGLGKIGRKVATIAEAFGAKVIYCSLSGAQPQEGFLQVPFSELLKESDIISIHAPLNQYTEGVLDKAAFAQMKESAILLNTGRGAIVKETDLKAALEEGQLAAAGLDVLSQEPMNEKNPLRSLHSCSRLFITPHVAWASIEARTRALEIILSQIESFFHK